MTALHPFYPLAVVRFCSSSLKPPILDLNNAVDRALSISVFITTYGMTVLIGIWPQIGKSNKPVTEARFKDCGATVEKQVRPPVPEIGGSMAYVLLG